MKYGLKIKLKRIEKGYTQKELGEKIKVTTSTVQKYEAGKREPKIKTMKEIAVVLGSTVQELFFSEEE
ncbi:helix-turn-helix transcriptional regulator [Clostridium botulinum]|nr:helix-turn-helix transcriptional regulator [Clostridium botulinum]NFM03689.1 helix-turn-helix transcriptional regulator [Clostridium botulinum]